jgi:hypothetical protein
VQIEEEGGEPHQLEAVMIECKRDAQDGTLSCERVEA